MEVLPLSDEYAQKLALKLLEDEEIEADDMQATAQSIAKAVDGIAHYIHHVIDQAKFVGIAIDQKIIHEIVENCLIDPVDRWHMSHYYERIDDYYTPQEQPYALGLLNILASSDKPIPFDEIFNLLKSKMVTEDKEMVRDMLTLLRRDHYVSLNSDGTYQFRFPLIKRWWRMNRG